jgi:transcriptional regulator with XRE-family HTH domain
MKLGDVLRKERERKQLSVQEVASSLGTSVDDYNRLETDGSAMEEWGLVLSQFAIRLKVPTSRLISETGKSAHARVEDGQCGRLLKNNRDKQGLSQEDLAKSVGMSLSKLQSIENGSSPLETFAPLLLRFAELIDQPVFNLFYPCGLPLDKLDDYP